MGPQLVPAEGMLARYRLSVSGQPSAAVGSSGNQKSSQRSPSGPCMRRCRVGVGTLQLHQEAFPFLQPWLAGPSEKVHQQMPLSLAHSYLHPDGHESLAADQRSLHGWHLLDPHPTKNPDCLSSPTAEKLCPACGDARPLSAWDRSEHCQSCLMGSSSSPSPVAP